MELKLVIQFLFLKFGVRFNRTFMELKFNNILSKLKARKV